MPTIEIKDGVFQTERFKDQVRIPIPRGGRVEIQPSRDHTDVEIRDSKGARARAFRLPREERSQ